MEQIISQHKTKFESSELFLFPLYTLMFLMFCVFFLVEEGIVACIIVISLILILYLILVDKLIWEWKGVETVLLDDENLIIRRKPKIFGRETVVPLLDIDAVEYREQTTLESSWWGPSVSDWKLHQEKLQVRTWVGAKIFFGVNLTWNERDDIIELIMERVETVQAEAEKSIDEESEAIEW